MGVYISRSSIRSRVLQPIHRPTQRYLSGFLHSRLMWPDTERTPPKPRLKLIVYWTSCVRWRMRRTTRTEKSVSWRGQSISLLTMACSLLSYKCDYLLHWCRSQNMLRLYPFLLQCLSITVKTFSVSAFDEADVLTGLLSPPLSFCVEVLIKYFFLTLSGL